MIPILFEANETQFNTFGIGHLNDASRCVVTEERNGIYELEMDYTINGILFEELQENRIIFAKPSENKNPQAFRIYKITEPMDMVTVHAEHISYQLSYIPVAPITSTSCIAAFQQLKLNSLSTNPFNFYTDKNIEKVYTTSEPKSARNILGGTEGSILQEFQGEYEFDNWDVHLWTHRGSDTGVTLRYGKNITDFEREKDLTNTVTGVLPYWKGEDTIVIGDISEISSGNTPKKIETVDVSSDITSDQTGFIPTKAQVTQAGYNALQNKSYIGVPSVNFKISFVALWQTEEYKDIAPLERVGLCDTVKIVFEPLDVETTAKVIRTEYDVLLERYNEIEIGDKVTSLSEKIVAQSHEIKNVQTRIEKTFDTITIAVENGAKSSIIKLSGEGIQTQAKEIKFTGGVVFSDDLTDGVTTISGDNIKTGTINADLINAGRLYASGNSGHVSIDTETGKIEWDMGNSTLDNYGNFISHGLWSTGIINGNIYSASGNSVSSSSYDAAIEMHNSFSNISGYVTQIKNDHIAFDGRLYVRDPNSQNQFLESNENGSYVGSDSFSDPLNYNQIDNVACDLSFDRADSVVQNLSFGRDDNFVSNLSFDREYSDFVRNLSFETANINGQTVLTSASWNTSNAPLTSASWENNSIITSAEWTNISVINSANWNESSFSYVNGCTYRPVINGIAT